VANKSKLEYKTRHIEMNAETWAEETRKVDRLCNDMQAEGWSLRTMSWPDQKHAVFVFTRPQA